MADDFEAQARSWLTNQLPASATRARRIDELVLPVASWVHERLRLARPLLVGLSAPQGAGKTTLTSLLVRLFHDVAGLDAVTVSIDDFYLRRDEQLALAARHPGNRALEHRGFPGTHDVALGVRVLDGLRRGEAVELPRYDKSAHDGRGDRSATTTPVATRQHLVFVEGWMLGFQAVEPSAISDASLLAPNAALPAYQAWRERLDVMVQLRMAAPELVVRWRIEAEQAMRASGRPALSDAAAEDYVRRFLPAYALWSDSVPRGWPAERLLSFTLDADRLPTRRSR